jgi:hypothetical protein
MLSALVRRLARDLPRRLVVDWMTPTAVALAVVLGHSAWGHFQPTPALAEHYVQALGNARWAPVMGALQLAAALGLLLRATRRSACAMLISLVLVALANRIAGGRAADGIVGPVVILVIAVSIALGEHARLRASSSDADERS